jgi:hypothetical protein
MAEINRYKAGFANQSDWIKNANLYISHLGCTAAWTGSFLIEPVGRASGTELLPPETIDEAAFSDSKAFADYFIL